MVLVFCKKLISWQKSRGVIYEDIINPIRCFSSPIISSLSSIYKMFLR